MNKMLYLLHLIHSRKQLTQDSMEALLGISLNTIKKWIADDGTLFVRYRVKVAREGSARKGKYVISDWGVLDPQKVKELFSCGF